MDLSARGKGISEIGGNAIRAAQFQARDEGNGERTMRILGKTLRLTVAALTLGVYLLAQAGPAHALSSAGVWADASSAEKLMYLMGYAQGLDGLKYVVPPKLVRSSEGIAIISPLRKEAGYIVSHIDVFVRYMDKFYEEPANADVHNSWAAHYLYLKAIGDKTASKSLADAREQGRIFWGIDRRRRP